MPGDLRITYRALPSKVYTVVGVQEGVRLQPYRAPWGHSEGLMVVPGEVSFPVIAQFAQEADTFYNYLYRGYGCVLMWLSMLCLLIPFRGNFKAMPFLGAYSRFLSVLLAAPLTAFVASILHRSSAKPTLPLVMAALVVGIVSFIVLNRETPQARL